MTRPIQCSIMRGGTSKGVFFGTEALPDDRRVIERILLNVFGSPDVRQIDGLGGATSQTSKAAIIGPPSRSDADIDYTFAQVSVSTPLVDWGGNCGNLSSAVGPYAIDHGLVSAPGSETTVRIHNTNTSKIIVAHVPVEDGRAASRGEYTIPGVPGTGARIDLEFMDPAGSVTGKLLPTGRPRDEVTTGDGRRFTVSVIDAANPIIFLLAEELGLTGHELPSALEARTDATDALEEVRSIVAEWLGIVADRTVATSQSPGLPKVGMVAPPGDYTTSTHGHVPGSAYDIAGRLMSMQTAHRSYMVTGAVPTAAAAFVEGTIVHELARRREERDEPDLVRIGNPYGVMDVPVRTRPAADGSVEIVSVTVGRTARHILDGKVWLDEDVFATPAKPEASTVAA